MGKRIPALRGLKGREALRLMQKMGVGIEELDGVKSVEIKPEGKKIVVENPRVATVKLQGQTIFQIMGGEVREEAPEKEAFSEEDVRLVAEQAGRSLEEARRALEEADGDLARAILLLKGEERA